jgi:hypothetical protein
MKAPKSAPNAKKKTATATKSHAPAPTKPNSVTASHHPKAKILSALKKLHPMD